MGTVLPAQYRMRRSADFAATVKYGRRVVQRDIVIHARGIGESPVRGAEGAEMSGPRVGLIIGKSVGSAVQRHRVARRLRHAARSIIAGLEPSGQVVIRALPGSSHMKSGCLEQQLKSGLECIGRLEGGYR